MPDIAGVPCVVGFRAVWHPGNNGVRTGAIIPGNASGPADVAGLLPVI